MARATRGIVHFPSLTSPSSFEHYRSCHLPSRKRCILEAVLAVDRLDTGSSVVSRHVKCANQTIRQFNPRESSQATKSSSAKAMIRSGSFSMSTIGLFGAHRQTADTVAALLPHFGIDNSHEHECPLTTSSS